jgi:hypothetical protein
MTPARIEADIFCAAASGSLISINALRGTPGECAVLVHPDTATGDHAKWH